MNPPGAPLGQDGKGAASCCAVADDRPALPDDGSARSVADVAGNDAADLLPLAVVRAIGSCNRGLSLRSRVDVLLCRA